jgi:hypothetical protein
MHYQTGVAISGRGQQRISNNLLMPHEFAPPVASFIALRVVLLVVYYLAVNYIMHNSIPFPGLDWIAVPLFAICFNSLPRGGAPAARLLIYGPRFLSTASR